MARIAAALAALLLAALSLGAARGMRVPAGGSTHQASSVRWPHPPWAGRGIHVAWGFRSGQWSPEQLAGLLASHGFQWACVEDLPDPENEVFFAPFRDALHARGLRFCIWERDDIAQTFQAPTWDHVRSIVERYHPDFWGADIEVKDPSTGSIYDPSIPSKFAQTFPSLPRIMLAAGMLEASFYQPWIAAGWDVMTEAYSGPLGQPPCPGIAGAIDSDAKWRGFPLNWIGLHSVPILEIHAEGSADLASQLCAVKQWGQNYSVWNAELMTDADWRLFDGSIRPGHHRRPEDGWGGDRAHRGRGSRGGRLLPAVRG